MAGSTGFRIHVGRPRLRILWPPSGSSLPRGSPSGRALPAQNPVCGRMGSVRDAVEISSDEEDPRPAPVARKLPCGDAVVKKGESDGAGAATDDDDCVVLDGDPDGAVAVVEQKGAAGNDGSSDELQIVAEKGQVACRDFPHSRHLCSNLPFSTTSHEKHCTMCYCFVCDVRAPCDYWGKGLSIDDHCHATDKETKWKTLRLAFKCKGLPASHPEKENAMYPAMASVDRLSLGNRSPLQNVVNQNQQMHTSARTALNVTPTVSAPRAEGSTSNAHTSQVTYPVAPTVSAPRAFSGTRAEGSISNAHTSQVTNPVAPTIGAPRAYDATRDAGSTSNAHTSQVTYPVAQTVGVPRPHPAARTGRGSNNAHTYQATYPVAPTVSAPRPQPVARTGRGSNNSQNAQITHLVEPTASAPKVYPAAMAERGNAHTAQITYPTNTSNYLLEPEPDQYEDYGEHTPAEYASEASTVYVGNLPYHIDDESLALSFDHAGVVVFSKVIYDEKTGQSRGFGYVTMSTVEEAEKAVGTYHGYVIYGSVRPLTVYITAPRQSGCPFKIFVCNLPWQVDDSWLEKLFNMHGEVVDARVVYYEYRGGTRRSRGFGFVTMATEEQSYCAINSLNKQILEGHTLRVKVSRAKTQQGY
ncbi:28 kDa ribonucleoprotein, chloroplastic [Hordeum vulgare]|nr:28 kDa ribonucleoprotein, chloroplastic [Hordeum vulgare]